MAALTLENVNLSVDEEICLDNISLHLEPGQLYTLLGRTGAGKTSLIRAIAGLETLDSGSIHHGGHALADLAPWQRPVAMVYQQFINYPHLSVLDNVAFPLRRQGVAREEARERAMGMVRKVGLEPMAGRKPGELSGGQQQRVAIARALAKDAPVVLLDEPLVNLDYKLREQLREDLVELLADRQSTIVVYASTEPAEALQMSARLVLMEEGSVIQQGAPREVFGAPVSVGAARVVNDPPMNILSASVTNDAVEVESLGYLDLNAALNVDNLEAVGADGVPPGQYYMGLYASDFHLAEDGRPAEVTLTEVSGSETITHLDMAGSHLVLHERAVVNHRVGSQIHVRANLSKVFLFDRNGDLVHVATPEPRVP